MKTLVAFGLNEAYKDLCRIGDHLAEIGSLMDWEAFRPMLDKMHRNRREKGGIPNFDEVIMIKVLILGQWHDLTDQALERQIADRISIMRFLGFLESIPDSTMIWLLCEHLIKSGKIDDGWAELNRQLQSKGMHGLRRKAKALVRP